MQKPNIKVEESDDRFGVFVMEPLERGFGHTIGNTMRRILLSSIPGAAVTALRIDGTVHEFSAIKGIKEDTIDLILNLKELVLRMDDNGPVSLMAKVKGARTLTAKDLEAPAGVEILNPELKIATINKEGELTMELVVERGRGYVSAERNKKAKDAVGTIPIDSMFSPVVNVAYRVQTTRVGQRTDYDKLILEITTDGSMKPDEALSVAAKILIEHVTLFSDLSEDTHLDPFMQTRDTGRSVSMEMAIDELELSVRSSNCLHREGVKSLGQLLEKTEDELLAMRNFGQRSIDEVKEKLGALGLELKKSGE
ncbi:MAG: DNA-directed RNA polymerase subunit alpha [Candidatus Geothermincolia bacterium]